MRLLIASVLLVAACKCPVCPTCPACPDMSSARDMAQPADMISPADLSCIKCDAVLNPCPALGLYCDPVARCCDSLPH